MSDMNDPYPEVNAEGMVELEPMTGFAIGTAKGTNEIALVITSKTRMPGHPDRKVQYSLPPEHAMSLSEQLASAALSRLAPT